MWQTVATGQAVGAGDMGQAAGDIAAGNSGAPAGMGTAGGQWLSQWRPPEQGHGEGEGDAPHRGGGVPPGGTLGSEPLVSS